MHSSETVFCKTCLLRLGCKAVAINFLAIFSQMQESKTCGGNYIDVVFRPIAHNCPTGKNVTIRVSVFVFLTPETSILLESSPGKTFASSLDWLIKWSSLGFSLRYYAQETRYWLGSYFRNVTSKILNKDAICCLKDVNFFFQWCLNLNLSQDLGFLPSYRYTQVILKLK